jgi:hypothetical protein
MSLLGDGWILRASPEAHDQAARDEQRGKRTS